MRFLGALGASLAIVALASVASADIHTFWKTDICPDFGGLKPPIAAEVGLMEAVIDPQAFGSAGGHMCVLGSTPKVATPVAFKTLVTGNAQIVAQAGDIIDIGDIGDSWMCVVCQYEDKVSAHPALSVVGTAVLMGGLLSGVLYELRRRRDA
jgi:hypothetical protein